MSLDEGASKNGYSELHEPVLNRMEFSFAKGERLTTARGLRMIVKDGYTQIFSGDRQPPWFLEGDDIREVRDHDNNRWIVSVAENEIIAGFLLEPDMTMGDLVICLAERKACRCVLATCASVLTKGAASTLGGPVLHSTSD